MIWKPYVLIPLVVLVSGALLLTLCSPRKGDFCRNGETVCRSAHSEVLYCSNEDLILMCKGE